MSSFWTKKNNLHDLFQDLEREKIIKEMQVSLENESRVKKEILLQCKKCPVTKGIFWKIFHVQFCGKVWTAIWSILRALIIFGSLCFVRQTSRFLFKALITFFYEKKYEFCEIKQSVFIWLKILLPHRRWRRGRSSSMPQWPPGGRSTSNLSFLQG